MPIWSRKCGGVTSREQKTARKVLVIVSAPSDGQVSIQNIKSAFASNPKLNCGGKWDECGRQVGGDGAHGGLEIASTLSDEHVGYNLGIMAPLGEDDEGTCVERTCLEIQNNFEAYFGFVVVRTDSQIENFMSELSFAIEANSKSIIVVGHRKDLVEALEYIDVTLAEAIDISSRFECGEVCYYQQKQLYRGNRIRRDMAGLHFSPNHAGLGQIRENKFRPSFQDIPTSPFPGSFLFSAAIDRNLLLLTLVPNQSPHLFDILRETDAQAIIIESYGIGNVPKLNQPFLDLIKHWREAGKVIFSYSQCDKGYVERNYSTSFEDLGIMSAADMTPAAVQAKLGYLLAKGFRGKELVDKMGLNMRGETSSPSQSFI